MSEQYPGRTSSYLNELPAIYRQEARGGRPDFLNRFLLAFERVMSGLGDPDHPGLEEILEGIPDADGLPVLAGAHRYFDPGPGRGASLRTPQEFLKWLAGWVALTLREDWKEEERRRILATIVPAYRRRGTPEGLRQILAAFTGLETETISILEFLQPMQLAVTSTIGLDTVLGEGPPHYFLVEVQLQAAGTSDLARKRSILKSIIDAEKPAHTYYDLRIVIPTLRIGYTSHVGKDTVLGTAIADPV